jgi:hypothetical protein
VNHTCINTQTTVDGSVLPPCEACRKELDGANPKPLPARMDFLRARWRYIRELAAEGERFDEIARVVSCDPMQAQLIAMTESVP